MTVTNDLEAPETRLVAENVENSSAPQATTSTTTQAEPAQTCSTGGCCGCSGGVMETVTNSLQISCPKAFRIMFGLSASLSVIGLGLHHLLTPFAFPWFIPLSAVLFFITFLIGVTKSAVLAEHKRFLVHLGIFSLININTLTCYTVHSAFSRYTFPYHIIVMGLTSICLAIHTQKRYATRFSALCAHINVATIVNFTAFLVWAKLRTMTRASILIFVAPLIVFFISLTIHAIIAAKRAGKFARLSAYFQSTSTPVAPVAATNVPIAFNPAQPYYIVDPTTGAMTLVQPGTGFPQFPMQPVAMPQQQAQPMMVAPQFQPMYPAMYPAQPQMHYMPQAVATPQQNQQ